MSQPLYQLLAELDRRYRAAADAEGDRLEIEPRWSGLGLRVGPWRLLLERAGMREICRIDSLARLPHAAAWLAGLVAVRGDLLPLIDLRQLLRPADAPEPGALPHLALVIEAEDMRWALGIDQAIGQQSFFASQRQHRPAQAPAAWCDRCFPDPDGDWWQLDLAALLADPALQTPLAEHALPAAPEDPSQPARPPLA